MSRTRLLNSDAAKHLITLEECNEIVERNFIELGNCNLKNPSKVTLHLGDDGEWPKYEGFMNAMPAYIGWLDIAGMKWVGGFDGLRQAAGFPYITAMILLVDPQLGTFDTILDGTEISNLRTGAQVPVIMKNLGVKPGEKIKIGLFGKGVQAQYTLRAIDAWYDIESVKLWNHREFGVDDFIEEMEPRLNTSIEFYENSEDVCKNVDIILTTTKSMEPLVEKEWVDNGTIIIPMGSGPELSNELILAADYIAVDHLEQAKSRAALAQAFTDGVISEEHVDAELAELSTSQKELPNLTDKIAIAVPVGLGAHDIAIAGLVAIRAEEENLGQFFSFHEA